MKSINKEELHEIFNKLREQRSEYIFNELYAKYSNLVYKIAFSIVKNKESSEDIKQIVFIKIWKMELDKLPLKYESSWLYSLTKNETINFLKKKNSNISIEGLYEIEDTNNEINKIIDKDSFNRMISKLNNEEKEIVSLKILGQFSFDEIGKILNRPTGTIKWKYYKSIHTLRILLSNLGMFIISLVTSIIAFNNGTKKSDLVKEELNDREDTNFRVDEEIKENPDYDKIEDDLLNKEERMEENIIVDIPVQNTNVNYIGIGFMGISAIFFITTIIFSIFSAEYQLKRRKKLSK